MRVVWWSVVVVDRSGTSRIRAPTDRHDSSCPRVEEHYGPRSGSRHPPPRNLLSGRPGGSGELAYTPALMALRRTATRVFKVAILGVVALSVAPLGAAPQLDAAEPPPFHTWAEGPEVLVPASIDATGASDVSDALAAFVDAVPDGSTIAFQPAGRYRLGRAIRLEDRHRLSFTGHGAQLDIAGCDIDDSGFVIDHLTSDVAIRDLTIVGDDVGGGTADAFTPGCESAAGVAVYSGRNVEIAGVTIEQVRSECLYVDAGGPDYTWADGVWFHDSTCTRNGRMGVAIAGANGVMIERVTFSDVGMFVLDIEPYDIRGGATKVTFRANTVERYGLSPLQTQWFVAAEGVPGSLVEGLTVTGNHVLAGAPRTPNTATDAGLATTIRVPRRRHIVFTDNTTTVEGRGPALFFAHIDGLTVSGNVQPLTRGSIASFKDCEAVSLDGMGPSS
jgi:hypothetical protein